MSLVTFLSYLIIAQENCQDKCSTLITCCTAWPVPVLFQYFPGRDVVPPPGHAEDLAQVTEHNVRHPAVAQGRRVVGVSSR